jgi:hypothetical protein
MMGYREPTPTGRFVRGSAWTAIAIGSASIAFLAWHQATMLSSSARYGLEVPWLGSLLTFVALAGLEIGAAYAALKQHYAVAIGLGGFLAALLGLASILVLGGAGM